MSAWYAVGLTCVCLASAYALYLHYRMAHAQRDVLFAYDRLENLLKQKLDLVPAVVSALRVYLSHERDTIDSVMRARRLTVDARMAIKEHGLTEMCVADLSNNHHLLNQAFWDLLHMLNEYPAISMDHKLGGLLQEMRELDPLVRSAVYNYNARIVDANQERSGLVANALAKLSNVPMVYVCESSAIDLSTVRWQKPVELDVAAQKLAKQALEHASVAEHHGLTEGVST
jgi:LemA protein